jgi:hypothetical protein
MFTAPPASAELYSKSSRSSPAELADLQSVITRRMMSVQQGATGFLGEDRREAKLLDVVPGRRNQPSRTREVPRPHAYGAVARTT